MNNSQFNGTGWVTPGYSSPSYPPMNPVNYPAQPQVNTNILLVTSLEEAKYKTNGRNMDFVFFNQNKDEFYRVKTDNEGVKSWTTFPFIAPNQADNTPATVGDLKLLSDRLMQLETAFMQAGNRPVQKAQAKKKIEEVENNELNG